MATLQNLRDKGPLLIIVVGLALFAFIVGDLWKAFESSPQDVTIGTIDETEVSAYDYQQKLNKQLLVSGQKYTNDFPVNNSEYIANEVWNKIVLDSELKETAEEMGFGATENSLINAINTYINGSNSGTLCYSSFYHTMWWVSLRENYQFLESFILALGDKANAGAMEMEPIKQAWEVTKENLKDEILYRNASNFINNSLITNPVTAKLEYDINNNTYDIDVISFPYSTAAVSVTDEDYNAYYEKNKNNYNNLYNSRDLNIFDYTVVPSGEDIRYAMSDARTEVENLKADTTGYTQLASTWDTSILPAVIRGRIEDLTVDSIPAPYYNGRDHSITIYQLVEKADLPEEIKFSYIVLAPEASQSSDSIVTLLNNGTSFKEYAEANNMQQGAYAIDTTCTFTENAKRPVFPDTFFKAELNKIIAEELPGGAKVIYQVTSATNPSTRHKVFFTQSIVSPSSQTIEEASEKFNAAVSEANNNYSELEKSAAKFNTYTKTNINYNAASTGVNINNKNFRINELTKRWILDVAAPGEISEVISDGNVMYVVSVAAAHNKGTMTLDELKSTSMPGNLRSNIIENKVVSDKYAANVVNETINGKTFEQLSSDSTLNVQHYSTFNINTSAIPEYKIHALLAKMQEGETETFIGDTGVYVVRLNKKNKSVTNEEEYANEVKNYAQNRNAFAALFTLENNALSELIYERYNENFVTFYNSAILKSIVENSDTEDDRYKHF